MRRTMTRTRKKGTPVSELGRDMYGFIVRPQHLQRYREFASIYKEEEAERSERWENFLRTYNDPALSSDSAINKPGVQSNGEVDFALEKQDSEAGKPRTIQRWAELRASLNIVEQGVTNQYRRRKSGKHDGNEILSAGQEHDNNAESVKARKVSNEGSGDESDDEFYDPDGMNDSASDNESSPFTGQDCPWREELQFLVRGGVPMALRGELWQVFVGAKTRRVEGHYDVLLTQSSSNSNGNGHSQSDSLAAVPALEKWANQIEKDLPRTFPGHPALDEDGRNALRRLLTAYARHNPDVGYCQAMNFFAALLLLLMPEENAFWTLTGIIDDYFEGYYSEKLLEAQVDQLVFEELAREYFPKLISHLDALGVQIGWICGPWFLSIFVNVLPWESVLRVWDVLLFEGNRTMLFRTALALMDLHAPALMASRDAGDVIALMQTKACATFDSSQLVLTACMGFQKIDEQQLDLLRVKHRPVVLATLQERALELQLWRSSQGALAKKLSRKYSTKGSLSITSEVESGSAMTRDGPVSTRSVNLLVNGSSHDVNNGLSSHLVCPEDLMHNQDEISIMDEEDEEDLEEKDVTDLQEQVAWLKEELCHALEDKKRAMTRAEELELALMEMVKEDNRRELSAKVEKLESEFATLQQTLSEKQEQEKAMVQVLLRMEQEQKVTEDARRFAEQDAAAQRHAANALQEKYEQAMENLAAMEKRKVMAETMLEATLQYEAGQPGNSRRAAKEEEPSKWTWLSSPRSSDVTAPKSKPSSPADPVKPTDALDEPVARKQGLFSRINWLERNKTKSTSTSSAAASPDHSTQAPESLESNGLLAEGSLEGFDGDNAVSEGAHEIRNTEMSV